MRWLRILVPFVLLAFCAVCLGARRQRAWRLSPPEARAAAVHIDPNVMAVRILLGRLDTAQTSWDGSLTVTNGALARLEGWNFRNGDKITGNNSWTAKSLRARPGARRKAARRKNARAASNSGDENDDELDDAVVSANRDIGDASDETDEDPVLTLAQNGNRRQQRRAQNNAQGALGPVGVIAYLKPTDQTDIQVTTPQGNFHFAPTTLAVDRPAVFLEGSASAQRVPADYQVTVAATEDDFPAAAAAPDGTIWVAYVSYKYGNPDQTILHPLQQQPDNFDYLNPKGNGDQVRLAKLAPTGDGMDWTQVEDLTTPGQDVYRPALTVDSTGRVWIVWSQNVNNNWDLYGCSYRDGKLSRAARLTTDPGPDLTPSLAADTHGSTYLVWQGFRGGQADIFMATARGGSDRWSEPQKISDSPYNDWDPQAVCSPNGDVHIAWDTYDNGNYDVMMRQFSNNTLSPVTPVANSLAFEARPQMACDGQNRTWITWEEAPVGWGKDFGYWQKTGVAIYQGHTAQVRCYVDGKPFRTTGSLVGVIPSGGNAGNGGGNLGPAARRQAPFQASFPHMGTDAAGRVFLTYRRLVPPLHGAAGPTWLSYITWYTNGAWTEPVDIPYSDGMLDERPTAINTHGQIYMIHSSDGRSHKLGETMRYGIYVSPLPAPPAAPGVAGAPPLEPAAAPGPAPADPAAVKEREDLARIRAFRVNAGGTTLQPVRGDFHRHTEISFDGGGDGPLIDMFRYSLDAVGHDWICAGDHDYGGGREYTWWQVQKLDDALHLDTSYVPIFGYERSVVYPNGHRNVMFVQRGIEPLPRLRGTDPGNVSPNDTKMLYRYLRQFHGICASHTSGTNMGTDWRDNDPQLEPFVEIYQGDRDSYEYLGAPRAGTPTDSPGGYQPAGYVWNALEKGYKLGFQASSDHISTHMSYAVAYVERPTREAIQDAFRKRHCYGATDNIILSVTSGNHFMGDEFDTREAPRLHIQATGTGPISQLVVVKNNKVVYTTDPKDSRVETDWMDNEAQPGDSYYYVRIQQKDGQLAWGSPMWIHYKK